MRQDNHYQIKTLVGKETQSVIELLAQWRLTIFKEFPYRYVGNLQFEKKHLQSYANNPQSVFAIALLNNEIVAISTGIPLGDKSLREMQVAFQQQHKDIEPYYYYGEVLVSPMHRGQGLAKKLYRAQDEVIKNMGFEKVAIMTVIRDEPIATDALWPHLGFQKNNIILSMRWPTITASNDVIDAEHQLAFWEKGIF